MTLLAFYGFGLSVLLACILIRFGLDFLVAAHFEVEHRKAHPECPIRSVIREPHFHSCSEHAGLEPVDDSREEA